MDAETNKFIKNPILKKTYSGKLGKYLVGKKDSNKIELSVDNFIIISKNKSDEDFDTTIIMTSGNLLIFSNIEEEISISKNIFEISWLKILKVAWTTSEYKLTVYILCRMSEGIELLSLNFNIKQCYENPISK